MHVDTQHAQHDQALIAGLAADDLTASERTRAEALLASCTECSALRADLISIAAATKRLPSVAAPRDFTITAEQAARLRRTGWLGALLAPFAGARSAARPIAATFTTLGLVGVFVAAAMPAMLGGAASMAAPEGAGAPGLVASAAPGYQYGPAATATSDDRDTTKDSAQASAEPLVGVAAGGDGFGLNGGRVDAETTPANPLLVGSLALLAVGLVLFGLRFAGRRLR